MQRSWKLCLPRARFLWLQWNYVWSTLGWDQRETTRPVTWRLQAIKINRWNLIALLHRIQYLHSVLILLFHFKAADSHWIVFLVAFFFSGLRFASPLNWFWSLNHSSAEYTFQDQGANQFFKWSVSRKYRLGIRSSHCNVIQSFEEIIKLEGSAVKWSVA